MRKIIKPMIRLFCLCLLAGFVVNRVEKKSGWVQGHTPGWYEKNMKRPLDFGLSLFAVVLLWPVFLIMWIVVRTMLGSPVIFRQERLGLDHRAFTIMKYRSMLDIRGSDGGLLPDGDRLTGFGRRLRSTSLDELPELFNILKGDMSIVGPRPLLAEYLPRYSRRQLHRHDVRPGLTGLAQVSGRNGLSWGEKFRYDVKYVQKITFFGDLKILVRTIGIVCQRKGIRSSGSETMEIFNGNSI